MIKEGVFGTWHVMTAHWDSATLRLIKLWLLENVKINDPAVSYHCRYHAWSWEKFPRSTNFVFDREADAVMFALKWA